MSDESSDATDETLPGDAPSAEGLPDWHDLLRAALLDEHPDDIVLIGSRAAALLAVERDATSIDTVRWHRFDSLADCAGAPPEVRQADVALFTPVDLDGLERALGAASRLFPTRLLLLVESSGVPVSGSPASGQPASGLPSPERLFAFGFRRVFAVNDRANGPVEGSEGESADDGTDTDRPGTPAAALYEYRLRDYKQPPEWLNARFWANPGRFDLDEDAEEFGDDTDEFDEDDRPRD